MGSASPSYLEENPTPYNPGSDSRLGIVPGPPLPRRRVNGGSPRLEYFDSRRSSHSHDDDNDQGCTYQNPKHWSGILPHLENVGISDSRLCAAVGF